MTTEAIQKQIEAIRKANSEARQSQESAKKFLVEAGIVKTDDFVISSTGTVVNKEKKK
jgi:hypothetical protein